MTNAVEVEHLSKRYLLGETFARGSAREAISGWIGARGRRSRDTADELWSLRDVSFTVAEGEAIGVVGANGAGKSTLLKILTRIVKPTSGVSRTLGRVGSLLEVGTGFHPELTGRENVYLNGVVLGMSRRDVDQRFDSIIDFSGVARFLDTPVKRYSSGMYLRLAFAIAAHLEPDVLLVDEVLAVGDVEFQRKCLGKMAEVEREGRTIVFVSHDMDAIGKLCSRAVWLDHGSVQAIGSSQPVIADYLRSADPDVGAVDLQGLGPGAVEMHSLAVSHPDGTAARLLRRTEPVTIEVSFRLGDRAPGFDVALIVRTERGARVLDEVLSDSVAEGRGEAGEYTARVVIPPVLNVGRYDVGLWLGTAYETWIDEPALVSFELTGSDAGRPDRLVCLDLPWELVRTEGS